jgi:hypothetical protein
MRHFVATICISLAFLSLQGGKFAAYMYCRWEVLVVLQQKDCDCEKHLSSADENAQASSSAAHVVSKEKSAEYLAVCMQTFVCTSPETIHCFAAYNSTLHNGFLMNDERPPVPMVAA